MQRCTLVGEPFFTRDFGFQALVGAPLFFGGPELDELFVGVDFCLEFADDEFDVDSVVKETKAGDMVGNQVFRVAEINQRAEYPSTFIVIQLPFCVTDHVDNDFKF